jgi:ADP-ribosylglycohydrolase
VSDVDLAHARDCLLGGAVGDALGYPIEFARGRDILERQGPHAPERLCVDDDDGIALVSDDTQMTLFTAEALLDGDDVVARCGSAYLRWLATQRSVTSWTGPRGALGLIDRPRLQHRRAPGNTCLDALSELDERAPFSVAHPANGSKGCGAIMRSAPFALVRTDRATAYAWARDAGALTHGHPAGYLPGAAFAAIVWGLVRGEALADAVEAARVLLRASPEHAETLAALDAGIALGAHDPTSHELSAFGDHTDASGKHTRGGGWTGDAALGIAVAIAAAPGRADFAQSLWRAVAHDGDSDSTGALAGQLLGAAGSSLPEAWLAALELRELLTEVASKLVAR